MCKVGSYGRVLKELMELHIPKGDLKEIVFGPLDILVQFTALKSVDEFVEQWFNPVRMIGAEEALITRTLTFLVISAPSSFAEEPFAFLFLSVQPRNLDTVREALLTIPGVLSADAVLGPYDIICPVKAMNRSDFDQLISRIHDNVRGIEELKSAIVALMRF